MPDTTDPYVLPGTEVLANLPGLRDPQALGTFKYEVSALRLAELHQMPIPGHFDLRHLCAIHRHAFQDVYAWAGQIRTVSISKEGSLFAVHTRIQSSAIALTNALDIGRIAQDAVAWRQASRESPLGRLEPLAGIFSKAVRPSRAVAFEYLPRDAALAQHPEIGVIYRQLDGIAALAGRSLPGHPAGRDRVLGSIRRSVVEALDTGQPVRAIRLHPLTLAAPTIRGPSL